MYILLIFKIGIKKPRSVFLQSGVSLFYYAFAAFLSLWIFTMLIPLVMQVNALNQTET